MRFAAYIHRPGVPAVPVLAGFVTAQEAWDFLAERRRYQEDEAGLSQRGHSRCYYDLRELGRPGRWGKADTSLWLNSRWIAGDGVGSVYGRMPGSDLEELDMVYRVAVTADIKPKERSL